MSLINAEQAKQITQAAKQKAEQIQQPMNIAVVDQSGILVSFLRMDTAWLGSIDIALKKAKTTALFGGTATADFGQLCRDMVLDGIEQTSDGLVKFGGGVAIKSGGKVIGALGISGGSVDQDVQVANAGVAAVK